MSIAAEEKKLQNVRLIAGDARKFLPRQCPPDAFDRVNFFFPDPWHGASRRGSKTNGVARAAKGSGGAGGASGDSASVSSASTKAAAGPGAAAGPKTGTGSGAKGEGLPVGAGKPVVDRRVFSVELVGELARVCRVGARLDVATDVAAYAEHVLETCASTCIGGGVDGQAQPRRQLVWVLCSINRSSAPKGGATQDGGDGGAGDVTDDWRAGEPLSCEMRRSDRVELALRKACSSAIQKAGRAAATSGGDGSGGGGGGGGGGGDRDPPAALELGLQRPQWRPLTQYERRAIEEGRFVWDLSFRLVALARGLWPGRE